MINGNIKLVCAQLFPFVIQRERSFSIYANNQFTWANTYFCKVVVYMETTFFLFFSRRHRPIVSNWATFDCEIRWWIYYFTLFEVALLFNKKNSLRIVLKACMKNIGKSPLTILLHCLQSKMIDRKTNTQLLGVWLNSIVFFAPNMLFREKKEGKI